MQYSSNPNEGVKALIRSHPTLSGQYRQAVLHHRDRANSLKTHQFSVAKANNAIAQKQLELDVLAAIAPTSEVENKKRQLLRQQLEIEIAEIEFQRDTATELVDDAIREMKCCEREIDRINAAAGQDLGQLNSEAFQVLQSRDFKLRRVRFLAARSISIKYGLSVDAVEMLLEIPVEEQGEYLAEWLRFSAGFEQLIAAAQQKQINQSQ